MRFYLFGISALWQWHRMDARVMEASTAKFTNTPLDCVASPKSFEYAREILQDMPAPLHICVNSAINVRRSDGFSVHIDDARIKSGRFYLLGHGIYIASPELAFLQAAGQRGMTFERLIRHANALAATYYIDDGAEIGLAPREPLLSKRKLRRFLDKQPPLPGIALARAAAAKTYDGAASPKESEFAIKACLPAAKGGRNCPAPVLNYKITPSNKSRQLADKTFYRVDFCIPDKKLAIEYDSNVAHLSPAQKRHDEAKRQTLEREGYKVVSIVPAHLASRESFNAIMNEILRLAGARVNSRSKRFDASQKALFEEFATYDL